MEIIKNIKKQYYYKLVRKYLVMAKENSKNKEMFDYWMERYRVVKDKWFALL